MPLISEFFGIKIYMYYNDHNPAHFHAHYGELKALININEPKIMNGMLPGKQLKYILAWAQLNQKILLQNWENAKKHQKLVQIKPLG